MEEMNTHTPAGRELVRMSGIMKEFPGVKALDDVKAGIVFRRGSGAFRRKRSGKVYPDEDSVGSLPER